MGFWQEYKADNAIELLKQKLALNARVLRAGKWTEVPARELVPGDIVRVRLGDIIPADIKLTDGNYLHCHRYEQLFRQDSEAGRGRQDPKSYPEGHRKNRELPDLSRYRNGIAHFRCRICSW